MAFKQKVKYTVILQECTKACAIKPIVGHIKR